jgi:hypothetical protein
MMLSEDRGHPLAVLQADAGYWYQKLHRRVREDFAFSYLLLDRLRQKLDQRQTARYPAHAAVESPCQLIQSVAEALLQLRQQPTLFQRSLVFG